MRLTRSPIVLGALASAVVCSAAAAPAQSTTGRLSIDRIFAANEFRVPTLPTIQWLADGRSYIDVRANPAGGSNIVRVDAVTGNVTVLAEAAAIAAEDQKPIAVEELILGDDENVALLFHDTERVWRSNTRGVYHVIDLRTKRLVPVSARPGLQMFAKLAPGGRSVAFVRSNNLFVADLAGCPPGGCGERQLTTDGSEEIINGTTDWVYEEELGLRDAFRWSPDGRRIAYWRFDQSKVPAFPLVNELSLYPQVATLRYPKAGEPNSRVRVGVVDANGGTTTWIDVGADTGIYVARMEWLGSDSLVIQRLPRKQNRIDLLVASAATGKTRILLTERDSAYVDVDDHPTWINGGRQFLWMSDRSGWRQVFLYNRDGSLVRQVTRDGSDVLSINGVDQRGGWVYVTVAAPDPTQRQVMRYALDGRRPAAQVTTGAGTHSVTISPGARWLIDTYSDAATPATMTLYELPAMRRVRAIVDPTELKQKVAALDIRPPQFFRIPMPDGTMLDAYRIVPVGFDSTQRYPVLMYVYGGPAAPTVSNMYGGNRYLWHQMLAQKGYVIVSVDNRGAAWRGRAFRKVTQYRLGVHESQDQIDAARWLARQPWVQSDRIGIWGWSYGGYMTSLSAARGGDVFAAGVAVAPVSDWRLYDTIYTERYMWIPQENAEGYRVSSPISHVATLRARLLIVHGTGDDNVHPQNTVQLTDKLIAERKPFYQLLYPNRTHSISGGPTQAHLFDQITRFLDENLGVPRGVGATH
jgi:dipeptidyl-peptidase-4